MPEGPLEPVRLPPPVVTPLPGTSVRLAALRLRPNGAGAVLDVQARAPSVAALAALAAVADIEGRITTGVPSVAEPLPAVSLATRSATRVWTEYPGDSAAGAVAQVLADGRRRWFVPESGRYRRYDPSSVVRLDYVLRAPAPVVRRGEQIFRTGEALDFRYSDAVAVRAGSGLLLEPAPELIAAFGNRWEEVRPWLEGRWRFGSAVGGSGWNLAPLLAVGALGLWSQTQDVDADLDSGLPGLVVDPARFVFRRVATPLPPPSLVSSPYFMLSGAATYAGAVRVRAGAPSSDVEARVEVEGVRSLGNELAVRVP